MEYLAKGLEQPERLAVTDAAGAWSYQELLRRAQSVAARLARADLRPGDRAGLFLPRRKESVALFLGVLGAGGVAVPFSVRGAPREIAHQIVNAGISLVVGEPAVKKILADAIASVNLADPPRCVDAGALLETTMPGPISSLPEIAASAPALILYTSGTTGRPKGVVHTHDSLWSQVDILGQAWEWSCADQLLHILPLHHIHGLVNGMLGPLRAGAGLRFLDAFAPAEVWNLLAGGDASVFYAVPTIYHQLAAAWESQESVVRRFWSEGAGRLRLAVSGSAALPSRLWKRWEEMTGQALLERYGMTEIGMAISNPYRGERRPGTVGHPLPGLRVRLADESGADVSEGAPGEIMVQGRSLFHEYWNDPAATRASFRDGYFLTGDVAEVRDGYIRIQGRASVDILKSAGYKISALEIEEALREHPAVQEVAVVGVPDAEWGEIVTACVVPVPGQALTIEQVRGWCKERLAPYKAPRRLELRPELPRNALGKVVKPDLIRQLVA